MNRNEPPTPIDLDALASVTGGVAPAAGCPWKDIWDWIRGRITPQPVPNAEGQTPNAPTS